jgi:hypothetical protein
VVGRWKACTRKKLELKGIKFKVRMDVKAESLGDIMVRGATRGPSLPGAAPKSVAAPRAA